VNQIKRIFSTLCIVLLGCGEPIEEFDGFLAIEMEQLLASGDEKIWIRTARSLDGDNVLKSCGDSLMITFSRPTSDIIDENYMLFTYPADQGCDSLSFCQTYPNICAAQADFCAESPDSCRSFDERTFFAGTWEIVLPAIENGTTNKVQLNYPQDTTVVEVRRITSQTMTWTYSSDQNQVEETYQSK